jgi:hypothetical protein
VELIGAGGLDMSVFHNAEGWGTDRREKVATSCYDTDAGLTILVFSANRKCHKTSLLPFGLSMGSTRVSNSRTSISESFRC